MLYIVAADTVYVIDRITITPFYLTVSVYDSSALTESKNAAITWDYIAVSVSDLATTTDVLWIGQDTVTVYDSVSILDTPTAVLVSYLEQLEEMRLPTWELVGSFAASFIGSQAKLPTVSGLGYFGARLSEERIPLRTISANVADTDIGLYGGVNKLPTYSMSGSFGMRLNEYIPLLTLSASFDLAGVFSLDTNIPVRRLSASFRYPDSFTLSRQIPIWIGQGSLVLDTYAANLNVNIPGAFIFSGALRDDTVFNVAAYIPVWRLESSMYSGDMWLDAEIPMWIMEGSGAGVVSGGGVISYHSRFTDFILRYIRP